GIERIRGRAGAGVLHQGGAVEEQAEAVARVDVECPLAAGGQRDGGSGAKGDVGRGAVVKKRRSAVKSGVVRTRGDKIDDRAEPGETIGGAGFVEDSEGVVDVGERSGRLSFLDEKP